MNKVFIYFLLFMLTITSIACNSIQGKIEQRAKSFYLVNNSKFQSYKFIIKKTEIQNDSIYKYSTQVVELLPGDEKYLGEISAVSETKYPIIEKKTISIWKPMIFTKKMIEEDKKRIEREIRDGVHTPLILGISQMSISLLNIVGGRDTIINGKKMKYEYVTEKVYDTLHPFPILKYKYKYEVTGQQLLKK